MLSCSHIRLYQDSFSNFRVFFYSHATLLLILRRSVAAAYFHSQWSVQCVCWPHTRYPIPGLTPSPDFHDLSQNCSPASLSSQGGDFTLLRDALLWENTTLLPRLSMKERTWECFNPQPPPAPVIKKVNQIPIDSEWVGGFGGWGKSVGIESQL